MARRKTGVSHYAQGDYHNSFHCYHRRSCCRSFSLRGRDHPGQLIRERPSVPATKAEPVAETDSPLKPLEDKEDVATISKSDRR